MAHGAPLPLQAGARLVFQSPTPGRAAAGSFRQRSDGDSVTQKKIAADARRFPGILVIFVLKLAHIPGIGMTTCIIAVDLLEHAVALLGLDRQ